MRILFLDIDGVLNSFEMWRKRPSPSMHGDWEEQIDPIAVERLNKIVEATGAQIVVSSTWRKMHKPHVIARFLRFHGFKGKVIDQTPDFHAFPFNQEWGPGVGKPFERGHEIRHWLVENSVKLGVKSYAVLDDGCDMATVWHRHVCCDHEVGLDENGVKRAIELLETDLG